MVVEINSDADKTDSSFVSLYIESAYVLNVIKLFALSSDIFMFK